MSRNDIDVNDMLFGSPAINNTNNDNAIAFARDPVLPQRMPVTIDNLVSYDGNPRTQRNPEFDAIKESIRNRGLDHAPNITRKSPDRPYMIKDGGNTRLQALKELWDETKDPRFYTIDCMFYPWTSERDILVAHIVENEMRGKMNFIDRAKAAMRLKVDLEGEKGESLSVNQLAKDITALGWTLQHPNLYAMVYAFDNLLPYLPNTLDAGMGRPAVNATRKLLDTCENYWKSKHDSESDVLPFSEVWQPIFAELDKHDMFELDWAQEQLEAEMAKRLGIAEHHVRAEMQVRIAGGGGISNYTSPVDVMTQTFNEAAPAQAQASKAPQTSPQSKTVRAPQDNEGSHTLLKENHETAAGEENTGSWNESENNRQEAVENHSSSYAKTALNHGDPWSDFDARAYFDAFGDKETEDYILDVFDRQPSDESFEMYGVYLSRRAAWCHPAIMVLAERVGILDSIASPFNYFSAFRLLPMPREYVDNIHDGRAAWYFFLRDFCRSLETLFNGLPALQFLLAPNNSESTDALIGHMQIAENQWRANGGAYIDYYRVKIICESRLANATRFQSGYDHELLVPGVSIADLVDIYPLLEDALSEISQHLARTQTMTLMRAALENGGVR